MVHKNYKWNISKEKGQKVVFDMIEEILKEQKNYYDIDQALTEFADMLQSNQLIKHKNKYLEYLKTSGKDDYDSFQVRCLGKFLSEVINDIKIAYDVKD